MAKDLIKTDRSIMHDPEFKATVIKILAGLEKSTEDTRGPLTGKTKDLKTSQPKIKDPVTEIQNQLDVLPTRMEEEEQVSDT